MPALEAVAIGAACGASDEEVELCVRVTQRAVDVDTADTQAGTASA